VLTVVALGGNALMRPGERGTAAEQRANLRETAEALRPLFGDGDLVVSHGNGPQVGNELVRQERAADEVPPLPLYLAVAQTQAEIGAMIAIELMPVAGRPVVCVLTHVRVDENDPAFESPTKPVGPFYSEEQARELERDRGWEVREDAGRGWRRVVPSPRPLEVVEVEAIRTLLGAGTITVACGGGGIPVAERGGRLDGIDAVIDKDRASSLLAVELGADRLIILTDVDAVSSGWGTDDQRELDALTADGADALLPELATGSIGPKVEASAAFARATGREALITSPRALESALAGSAGTRVRTA
jgi:carbamate kinase